MTDKEDEKKLMETIKSMSIPLNDIPFPLVIEAISGHKVLPFDPNDSNDKTLLSKLIDAVIYAGNEMVEKGVTARRINEIGNAIEPFVRDGLKHVELSPNTPTGMNNRRQSSGYPDISITFNGKTHYIECKTYNKTNEQSSLRSFYLSPSRNFKVTEDGHHFIVSYEMILDENNGKYKPVYWRILSLDKLLVNVKYEFNTDNKSLYATQNYLILKENRIL